MEYELAPTPIRASYQGLQQANPVAGISYTRNIYRCNNLDAGTLASSATNTSVFELFPNADQYLLNSSVSLYFGTAGNKTKLIFPGNYFSAGDRLVIGGMGNIGSTLAAPNGVLSVNGYGLQTDPGSDANLTSQVSILTDSAAGVDDVRLAFWFEFSHQIVYDSTNQFFRARPTLSFVYQNTNSFGPTTVELKRNAADSFDVSSSLVCNLSFTWASASADNSLDLQSLYVDVT